LYLRQSASVPMFVYLRNESRSKHTGSVELALFVNLGLQLWTHRHFLGADTHELAAIQHSLGCALSDTRQHRSVSTVGVRQWL